MAKTTTKTTKTVPAPSAKATASGVTASKAPAATKAPAAAAPAPAAKTTPIAASSGCCGGHSTCATPKYEQIAQRAYEIWVGKGRPQGQDLENWKQAEAELMRGSLVTAA